MTCTVFKSQNGFVMCEVHFHDFLTLRQGTNHRLNCCSSVRMCPAFFRSLIMFGISLICFFCWNSFDCAADKHKSGIFDVDMKMILNHR
ncbi:hypothetical protein HanIR_Chr17g0895701 [Helianthus annuus]|nr:hypothetical protein HanIR_Chr17g0895701 [Helianthus annuus]